jgi:nucleosome binding factor SPN SPT16 subunit
MSRTGWSEFRPLDSESLLTIASSVDIAQAESPVNLNWNPIMKHINENPYEFFTTGGWGFLGASTGEEVRASFFF